MHLSDAEKARILSNEMLTLKGKGNHLGSAVGKTAFFDTDVYSAPQSYSRSNDEEKRYFVAHRTLAEKLRRIYGELRTENDAAWIFLMQITLLDDALFLEIPRLYMAQGKNAVQSVILCREYFYSVMCKKDDGGYLRSLSSDVDDVALGLISALTERHPDVAGSGTILITPIPLSSYIAANRDSLLGVVTSADSLQSHAAEIAASFSIPLIATEEELSCELGNKNALINSDRGYLYINPDLVTLTKFSETHRQKMSQKENEYELYAKPLVTKDGKQILVFAELKRPRELTSLSELYCDGIGNLSGEDFYFESAYPPDEEELFEEYRRAAEMMPTKPIMIKAFKTSGSVHLNSVVSEDDEGHSGELYVLYDGTFRTQLRSVMRAAVYGSLQFVLRCPEKYSDLFQCAQMMEELSAELYEEDREFTPVPFGVVIDSVAAALMCEKLIEECDFLIVDREKLAKELSATREDIPLYDRDDVYLDALEHLTIHVAKTATKKKKRAILSLGKCSSLSDISKSLINEFSAISANLDKLYTLKKKIIEM